MNKIEVIKKWLGTGSINILGIQFSGKDTIGVRLTETLGAMFISSGDVVRQNSEKLNNTSTADQGLLAPTAEFSELMENYLVNETPKDKALILSSVGRWIGEEQGIIKSLKKSGHPIKAVLIINIPEEEVYKRWQTSRELGDRDNRADDTDKSKVARRISEFKDKTLPVIDVYKKMGLTIDIDGVGTRDEVFDRVIDQLSLFSRDFNS